MPRRCPVLAGVVLATMLAACGVANDNADPVASEAPQPTLDQDPAATTPLATITGSTMLGSAETVPSESSSIPSLQSPTTTLFNGEIPPPQTPPSIVVTPLMDTVAGAWVADEVVGSYSAEPLGSGTLRLEFEPSTTRPRVTVLEGQCPAMSGYWSETDMVVSIVDEILVADVDCSARGTVPVTDDVVQCLYDGCPIRFNGDVLSLQLDSTRSVEMVR